MVLCAALCIRCDIGATAFSPTAKRPILAILLSVCENIRAWGFRVVRRTRTNKWGQGAARAPAVAPRVETSMWQGAEAAPGGCFEVVNFHADMTKKVNWW